MNTIEHSATNEPRGPRGRSWPRAAKATGLAALLLVGVAAGAGAMRASDRMHPQAVMLLQPTAISTLRNGTVVAVKGKVGDIYGNTFVVDDGSGRALVDTGRRGESRPAAAADETVTVQGRFERGRLQAGVVTHADGRSEGFGPPPPPPPPAPGGKPDAPAGGPAARLATPSAPDTAAPR